MARYRHKNNQAKKTRQGIDELTKAMDKFYVEFGIFGEQAPKAYAQEYGMAKPSGFMKNVKPKRAGKFVPPRPFIRPAIAKVNKSATPILIRKIRECLRSGNKNGIKEAFEEVGQMYVDAIKDEILYKETPPLRKSTIQIRQKRGNFGSEPLFETGDMIDAVSYKVKRKGAFETSYKNMAGGVFK